MDHLVKGGLFILPCEGIGGVLEKHHSKLFTAKSLHASHLSQQLFTVSE